MNAVKIEYPKGFDNFVKLLCDKAGAPESEARQTAEQIWRIYALHRAEKDAHSAELSPDKQKKVRKLLSITQEVAKVLHKGLTGPELRDTAETMLGPDYDTIEELLHKAAIGIKSKLSKRRRGAAGDWGLAYGARILIDRYKKWTGRKASITHSYGAYSGPIYEILEAWSRLTGVVLSGHGINSLHQRARKLLN
ncbi:MAG: hypothetical protein KA113_09045 [Syntrophaceae bacterium]|nr:hypothetical protein [Syntrophaceae bacterium]